ETHPVAVTTANTAAVHVTQVVRIANGRFIIASCDMQTVAKAPTVTPHVAGGNRRHLVQVEPA
ncbi:MAG: hypothetical protein ACM3ZE_18790, partial [Myxococcales bacterium]